MIKRQLVRKENHFMVWDNFLTEDQHRAVYDYIREIDLEFVHTRKKIPAFKITDGNPLWGDPILSHPYEKNTLYPVFPTGKKVDIVFEEVIKVSENNKQLVGERNKDWSYFFGRPYVYHAGTGLGWHTDGKYGAPGAFVYYAHPEWRPEWGGELLVSSPETKPKDHESETMTSNWGNPSHNALIMEHSIGHYVLPKPNRLVMMSGGFYHAIKKVDPSAGDNLRMTVQGFFQDPAKMLKK